MGTLLFADLQAALQLDLEELIDHVITNTDRPVLSSCSPANSSAASFAASQLYNGVRKRLVDQDVELASLKERQLAAKETFLRSNERCRLMPLPSEETLSGLARIIESWLETPSYLLGDDGVVRKLVTTEISPSELLKGLSIGPGAARGAIGDSFIEKISMSPLTVTKSDLYKVFLSYTKCHPLWASVEHSRQQSFGLRIVPGSRLSYAPKDSKTERCIATEPSLNMMFQLSLGKILAGLLKSKLGIDLQNQQEINRELARQGSISGGYSTIDLSSASDTISHRLVERLFPESWVFWLNFTRSPNVEIDGENHPLHMISSMGNGFTFPLETLIFSAVVRLAFERSGLKLLTNRSGCPNFAVFGDDIVVPTSIFRLTCSILQECGFEVNDQKSFTDGPFRESCGADWYNGSPVRPVRPKSLLTDQARYVFLNRLVEWMEFTGIPLPMTFMTVLESIQNPVYVPLYEQADAGLRVPFEIARDRNAITYVGDGSNRLYAYEAHRPVRTELCILTKFGALSKYSLRNKATENSVLLAVIQGGITGPGICLLRSRQTRYRLVTERTPVWDTTTTNTVVSVVSGRVRRDPALGHTKLRISFLRLLMGG